MDADPKGREEALSRTLVMNSERCLPPADQHGLEFVIVTEHSPVDLIRETLTVNEQGFDPGAPAADRATADAFRANLRGCGAVTARWQGLPVATGMFTPIRERRSELVGITTLSQFRRRGFGAALTLRLARAAFDAGAHLVFLTTDDDTALRTYRRVGFRDA